MDFSDFFSRFNLNSNRLRYQVFCDLLCRKLYIFSPISNLRQNLILLNTNFAGCANMLSMWTARTRLEKNKSMKTRMLLAI